MNNSKRPLDIIALIAFVLGSIILLVITIDVFYKNTSQATDENQFMEPPSKFIISKNIPAYKSDQFDNVNPLDSIKSGTYLMSISGINLETPEDSPLDIVNTIPQESLIPIKVYDVEKDTTIDYFIKKEILSDDFYTVLKSSALVIAVTENGASDRAGIKVGDLIVGINDKGFESVQKADNLMKTAQVGKLVKYKIFRDNQYLDFDVQLAKFGIKYSQLNTFIIGLIIWITGFLLFVIKNKFIGAKLLGISFVLLGFSISTPFRGLADIYYLEIFRYLPILSISFGFATYFHSLSYFPYIRYNINKNIYYNKLYYVTSIIIAIYYFIIISQIIKVKLFIDIQLVSIFFFTLLFVIINKIAKNTPDNFQMKLAKPLRIMTFSVFAMIALILALNIVINFGFVKVNAIIFTDLINSVLILFPITHIYVIFKYNLFETELRIRRNIKYTIVSFVWRIFAISLFLISLWCLSYIDITIPNIRITGNSIELLNAKLPNDLQEFYLKLLVGTLMIISFIVFIFLFRKLQQTIDKKFFRINYDYRRAATDFSNILAKHISINELVVSVSKELTDILHIKRLGLILFKNENKISSIEFTGFNSKELEEFCLVSAPSIYASLSQINKEINVSFLQEPINKILKSFQFVYIIPIKSKTKIFGAILLSEKLSESPFVNEDFDFISSIAGQLSVAVENGILYESLAEQERIKHELEIARKIQLASLPQTDPKINGLDIVGMSLPALEVGGDFYDYLYSDENEVTVVVGDVSGKGTSAALYMSKTQGIIRTLYEYEHSPRILMIRTNQLIYKYLEKNYFISAIAATFNTNEKTVSIARAGHLPLYYYNSKLGVVEKITPKGMMLGLKKERLFERNIEEVSLSYQAGDLFVLVTDGITEARNKMLQDFGEEGLISNIEINKIKSSVDIKNSILLSLQKFIGEEIQNDDLTLIVIKAE